MTNYHIRTRFGEKKQPTFLQRHGATLARLARLSFMLMCIAWVLTMAIVAYSTTI